MAVIFRGVAVFLEHPRTGSTALREALKKIGGQPHSRHSFVKARQNEKTIVTVRNPYDVLVSWWLIIGEREGYKTFADFLTRCNDRELMTKDGRLFYYDGDYTLHYEQLDRDVGMVLRTLGLKQVTLKRRNPTPNKMPYQNYYTPETKAIVERVYGEELARYGYGFEGLCGTT